MLRPGPYILGLAKYAAETGLVEPCDLSFVTNRLLEVMKLDSLDAHVPAEGGLNQLLAALVQNAAERGLVGDSVTERDLFDTKLMGALTPFPHEVTARFRALYQDSPQAATDWFYKFCHDVNYIRPERTAKDRHWIYNGDYGPLDITINLAKPEKDPRAIAAAGSAAATGYPACLLCPENQGYAGRLDHPARQNLRMIPIYLRGEKWFFQYSPYVYYNEHCIALNSRHIPMRIDRAAFEKLLDFVGRFPHYFMGSNADLPIVGGSILSHDHFQGGRYPFAMAAAPVETPLSFRGFEDIAAGIVRWPMSVIRLTGGEPERLAALAERVLLRWRGYTDESAFIYARTETGEHNTVTPIARRRGDAYELDMVLRNNITTPEHPLGLFHPHAGLHHIKMENIGLIEVMGLAVLPARLDAELAGLERAILSGGDISGDASLEKHAPWIAELRNRHSFTPENTGAILMREVGAVFQRVLEDAGVFKRDDAGRAAFLRFAEHVNKNG